MADARLDTSRRNDQRDDQRLVQFLAERDFTGPAYQRFEEAIARYGIAVISAWMHQKVIFDKCRKIGIKLPWPDDEWSKDDQYELTLETVGRAAVKLRHHLIKGEWDPGKGASLRSYFIRSCLYEFPETYRAWYRAVSRTRNEMAMPKDFEQADSAPGPEEVSVTGDEALRGLRAAGNRRVQTTLVLASQGYTHSEIAHILGEGVTARAVEGMLYRHRRPRDGR
jgi:hypothetical protein